VTRRVLVVGGGIAGLAVAAALHRRQIPAVVVDRLAGPPEAGLGLNLPGNAVRALAALGLDDALPGRGMPVDRREYRNARGRLLFAVDERAFWGPSARSVCLRRSDLLALLAAGLPADTIRWSTPVTAVRPTDQGAEVDVNGAGSERYDFVVGADGVHSAVRQAIFGPAGPRPAVLSAASWRFVTPNPGIGCWTVWSGSTGTFLLIPVDAAHVYGYASATRGGPAGADPQWLASTFAAFPDPVRGVVSAVLADPSSLYHAPVEEIRIDRWTSGPVALVGDAAHATAPVWAQGAALAVEDAHVLAEHLHGSEDWTDAAVQYERHRRPRVEHVQKMTDRLSRAAALPGWFRDAIMPFVGPRSYRDAYQPLTTPAL